MKLKFLLRDCFSALLKALPLSSLTGIRDRAVASGNPAGGIARFLRYREVEPSVSDFSIPGRDDLKFINDGSYISRQLFWRGTEGYEPAEGKIWSHLCKKAESVLELGGNVGFFSVLGASSNPDAAYTVVEPHPDSAKSLRTNMDLNNLGSVNVVEAAVVGEKTEDYMTLFAWDADSYAGPTGAHLSGGELDAGSEHECCRVKVVEVGDLVGGVDLIKMDVEGLEAQILGAVRDQLVSARPTILVEVLAKSLQLKEFIGDLCAEGVYTVYSPADGRIVEMAPEQIQAYRTSDDSGSRDLLLVDPNKADALELSAFTA